MTTKPKLLDQVRTTIRRKHYSIRTEDAYVDQKSVGRVSGKGQRAKGKGAKRKRRKCKLKIENYKLQIGIEREG